MTPPWAKAVIVVLGVVVAAAGCSSPGHHQAARRRPSPPGTTSAPPPTTTSAPATTATGPTGPAQPGTSVAYAAPVDITGRPLPSVAVTTVAGGHCNPGSDVIRDVEVYRCFSGNGVYDPCWAGTAGGGVLCMAAPWSSTAVHIPVAGIPPGVDTTGTELAHPWAVQLTSGAHCLAAQGARSSYQGKVIDFGCSGGPDPGLALLGGVDRSGRYWTYQSAMASGATMSPGPTVTVSTAWYAGPAPPTGSPRCGAAALSLSARSSASPGTVGLDSMSLLFRNTGAATCSLYGYPGVAALDQAGRQVAQARRASAGGAPTAIYVPPEAIASAYVQGNPSGGASASCASYPELLVTPPNTTTSSRVPSGQLKICPGFQVFPVALGAGP